MENEIEESQKVFDNLLAVESNFFDQRLIRDDE
jgi:hypothetical protein